MAKDPAFLFYSQDFYTGVATMSFDDRGKFITLLCLMHQQGRMSEETIRFLVGSISVNLRAKFKVDENGLWYNERLEIEAQKRAKFCNSRRDNGLSGGRPKKEKPNGKHMKKHMDNHMEDVNENRNDNLNGIENKKAKTKIFDPLAMIPDFWDKSEFLNLWVRWLENRKRKKKPVESDTLERRLLELIEYSADWPTIKKQMIKAVDGGWLMFVYPDAKEAPKNGIHKTGTAGRYAHEAVTKHTDTL